MSNSDNNKPTFKPVSPQTDFPSLERQLLEKWNKPHFAKASMGKESIVDRYLHRNNKSSEKFSFLDGPITANNPMGVHHAWGRTYKDFWQRFWNMGGRKQRFQNGFDEQGLWVEVEVEKELGLKSKKDIENLVPGDKFKSLEKFINLCKERVSKYSKIQTEQSKRLGYFMDWDNSYHTSSDENNYAIWNFLKVVNDKGWLYKGRDSVPWCPRCGTAISQHEILTEEYKELTHKTVVFKLKIKGKENEYLLAWTTTPWTIPGNVALAVDPKLIYWKMSNGKEIIYLISPEGIKDLEKIELLVNKQKLTEGFEKVGELKGKDLVGIEYGAPYDNLPQVKKTLGGYTHRVVATDSLILPINPAEGTGIVHVAPGAGGEDFALGKKEKLPAIEEIGEEGIFLNGFEFLSGEHVKKASEKILEDLEKRNLSFKQFDYLHRYPTCWRCKTELVWRVVDEWYIAMDRPSVNNQQLTANKQQNRQTFREQMMEVAKKINWMPSWGMERELDWLSNMHDWLISKKRYWGLALPIWECQKCNNFEVIGSLNELKEKAYAGFDEFSGNTPHRPWIDQVKIKCSNCGEITSRIPDVGNPWLDAGIVPFSTMPEDWFPADFITESFPGQFKNWFYSLIAMSTALKNEAPFKNLLGFATMLDEKGEAFHKSKGNAIEFVEGADHAGADVIRWVCLRSNPENNVLFGYHVADDIRRLFFLRLWNIYSFFVTYANLNKFQISNFKFQISDNVLDKWILSRLNESIKNVSKYIEQYSAYKAVEDIEKFVIDDLSNWYVRRSRERASLTNENSKDREQCLNTLYFVLVEYSKLLAPFIPFIADEIYTNLTDEESVHLADWPKFNEELIDSKLSNEMDQARMVVEVGHSKRKEASIKVRQPLNKITLKSGIDKFEEGIENLIKEELNVKNIEYKLNDKTLSIHIVEGKGQIPVIELDTKITADLKEEAEKRDIIRRIQIERKKLGTQLDEKVDVTLPSWPKEFEDEIKKKALINSLSKGEFQVNKI